LSTKNPTKKGLVLKLGLRGERPGTNSFNHGTGHLNMHNYNMWLHTDVCQVGFQEDLQYPSAYFGVLRKPVQ
jgi:hypothetical protein